MQLKSISTFSIQAILALPKLLLPASNPVNLCLMVLMAAPLCHGTSNTTHPSVPQVISYGQYESMPEPGMRVLTAEQFAIGSTHISDVLEQLNGLQLQPLGGLGDPVMVSIRGASGQQTRLLIDGIEVNQGQFGSYDLNALPLNRIAYIEILNASSDMSSGLTADQAIGGTINLITYQQASSQQVSSSSQSKPDTLVAASVGAWGTATASLDTGFHTPMGSSGQSRSHTRMWYEHQRSDNNYDYPVNSPEDAPEDRGRLEPLRNAEYHRDSLTLTQVTPWVRGSFSWQSEHKAQPYYHRNPQENNAALDSRTLGVQLAGNPTLTTEVVPLTLHWQVFQNQRDESFKDPQGIVGLGIDNDRYQYRHTQANLSVVATPVSPWQFGTGVQLAHQTYRSEYRDDLDSTLCTTPQGNCDAFSWLDQLQWLVQANWQNADDSQQFQLSAQHSREQRGQRSRTSQRKKESSSKAYPSFQTSWQQSYWLDNMEWLWRLAYKRTTRAPSLYEQFGDHGLLTGSPDLEPELSRTWSLDNQLSTEWLSLPTNMNLNLFQRKLEGAIVPVYSSTGVGRYENTHSATLNGVEWQWQQTLLLTSSRWHWSLSGSHYDSNTHDPSGSIFDGKRLPGIYHIRLLASLSWHFTPHSNSTNNNGHMINFNAELADDLYTGQANLPDELADQRRLISSAYRYQWNTGNAGLRINNLTNKRFTDYSERPAKPRQWTLFVQYQF